MIGDKNPDLARFANYLEAFFTKKENQLDYSNFRTPKRCEIVRIDLSIERDSSNAFEVKVPFRSLHVQRIFKTSNPVVAMQANCTICFDQNTIANSANSKLLQTNDAFILDQVIGQGFVTNKVFSDTTIEIAFMVDIEYRPGSTLSTITGAVNITGGLLDEVVLVDTLDTITNPVDTHEIGSNRIINKGQSGNSPLAGTWNLCSLATLHISSNPSRRGVFIRNAGSDNTGPNMPAGAILVSMNTYGPAEFSAGFYNPQVPSTMILKPGECCFVPAADTNVWVENYTPGITGFPVSYGAIVHYFEVY